MLKEAVCTAASIEEAQAAAVAELNAPEDANVTIEVIEIPVKKTLGIFGGNLAKVRAYYEQTDYLQVESYIRKILSGMGVEEVKIEVKETEDDIHIQLDCGNDYSMIIGRRGETLDAIQYLTRLAISRENDSYKRVLINVGNYRERRESTLRETAQKTAEKVKKYGGKVCLDPMNPYERRIVHTTIQEIEGVESHSVGTDNERKVVISLSDGLKPTGGSAGRPEREGFSGNKSTAQTKPQDFRRSSNTNSSGKTQPRTPHSDAAGATLYGKIEPKNKK